MASDRKRAQAEKVRRLVTGHLRGLGFARTRTSFWTRRRGPVVEFVHLHLFSYDWSFRVELGIRVLNDTFEAASLNGPCCADRDGPGFQESTASVAECALAVFKYVQATGAQWFGRWEDPRDLWSAPDSPLSPAEKLALGAALHGNSDPDRERQSLAILGVA